VTRWTQKWLVPEKQEIKSTSCQLLDDTQQKKKNPCSPRLHPRKTKTKEELAREAEKRKTKLTYLCKQSHTWHS